MKKVTKRIISVCVSSVVLVAAAATVTFSWYSYEKEAKAYNINLGVTFYAYQLKISLAEEEDYKFDIKKKYSGETFTQMSGDGVNFYMGEFQSVEEEGKMIGDLIGHKKITEDQYYRHFFYQEVILQASRSLSVYLAPTSYIQPVSLHERKVGNIAKDYIAGAMRMCVARYDEEKGSYVPFILWAPNSRIEYISGEEPEINPEGDVESTYSIVHGTNTTDMYKVYTDGQATGRVTVPQIPGLSYIWGNSDSEQYLFDMVIPKEEKFAYQKLAVSIWLDGNDRECVEALSGGMIKTSLKFTSEPIG